MIRLVPNTGIQFARLRDFSLKELSAFEFRARRGAKFAAIVDLAPRRAASADEQADDDAAPQFKPRSADMGLIGRLLKASPAGVWIPVPFDCGGLWAAVFLRATPEGRIEAVLGADTGMECDGNPEGLATDELGERVPMPCAPVFWRREGAYQHVYALAQSLTPPAIATAVDAMQMTVAGLAAFLGRSVDSAGRQIEPLLRVHLDARPDARRSVGVDVIVDLGNSRTCVLLREHGADGRRDRLELVYPDDPTVSTPSPFETQSAFFEHEVLPRNAEGVYSFRFLSMIKMGSGALDAIAACRRDPRPLGLSTPKRYLWETSGSVPWEWRCANREDEQRMPPRIHGDILRVMDPLKPLKSPKIPEIPPVPNYPRAACMVWAMVELLEQAFRQVNSPEWRRANASAPLSERRRLIRNLVVTYPAGLHSVELDAMRAATERAAQLWSAFRSNVEEFCGGQDRIAVDPDFGVPAPAVQLVCDEGLAIQVCWLYGEAIHRFQADPGLLLRAYGRTRGGVESLRLASIDIGGGTIDLAISDYHIDTKMVTAAAFHCKRLFHDSISRAGDDVIRGILEQIVFPAILKQAGISRERWNRIFASPSTADDSIRELRQRLVRSAWMPIAMKCLSLFERSGDAPVRFEISQACSNVSILESLQSLAADPKAPRTVQSIGDVVIEADRNIMRGIVRNTIGRTLNQCADIVDQYECDLLVVGGRPSGNPAIRDQIYASMAVPPGQVCFLSEQSVDDWYPFADGSGRIGDAKTCGVVGGWLAFAARHGMGQFMVTIADHVEPPPIIGFLRDTNPSKPPVFSDRDRLNFAPDAPAMPVMPLQPLVIATRNVDDAHAEARPIYRFGLKKQYVEALERNPGFQNEIRVRFELMPLEAPEKSELGAPLRPSSRRDVVALREGATGTVPRPRQDGTVVEVDADECIELLPRTLLDSDGYWIDTGVFSAIDQSR
jgi:hypothetical protein